MSPRVFPDPPWPVVPGVNYGRDLSCFLRPVSLTGPTYNATVFDLSTDMSEVDGRQGLSEALARRLVTKRGTLIDDPNYGFDVREFVNDDLDARELARIAASVDGEMLKDERVLRSSTTATLVGGALILVVNITDSRGPFRLVFSVSQASVSILQVPA